MNNLPTAYEGKEPYIFISYAHKDTNTVLPIIAALQDAGYPVWYDAGIQAGSEWPEYIAEHLDKAKLVLAFISQYSLASDNCRQEINFAIDKSKLLLTVRLDNSQLSPGLQMRLNLSQSLLAYEHSTQQSYINALINAPYLEKNIPKLRQTYRNTESYGGGAVAIPGGKRPAAPSWEPPAAAPTPQTASLGPSFGSRFMALLCYLGPLMLIPLLFNRLLSNFSRFHLNQSLLFAITSTVLGTVIGICISSNHFTNFNILITAFMLYLAFVFFTFLKGVLCALTGKEKRLVWLIGRIKIFKPLK